MKKETMKKLDDVAKACVAGLETEIACGFVTPEQVREAQARTKNPTRLEVIKAMIRTDLKRAGAAPAAARGLRFRAGTDFSATHAPATAKRHDSLRLVSNLFGLLRPARRLFPPSMRRQRDGEADRSAGEGER